MTPSVSHDVVAALSRLPGVRAAAVVAVEDGLVVRGSSRVGVELDAVAALGASLVRRSRAACADIGRGAPRAIAIDALGGRLHVAIGESLAVVVVADPHAHPGMIRVTAQRAVDDLSAAPSRA
jgi:predicted regulator of Ras-like GTPase activity (Roadblock/LC7/MglB family)